MNSFIIFSAQYLVYIVALAALIYWLTLSRRNKLTVVVYGLITGVIAFILAKIGSALYNNPRPFMTEHVTALFSHAPGNGFPSDHTLLTASLALALFAVSKKWGIVFMILAVIIGGARVLAHVHHSIDIIGSIVFAAIGYGFAVILAPKIISFITRRTARTTTDK